MDAQEKRAYLRGFEAGAMVIGSHVALGHPGVGVSIVQGMALEQLKVAGTFGAGLEGPGLAVAQGLADAALVGEGR